MKKADFYESIILTLIFSNYGEPLESSIPGYKNNWVTHPHTNPTKPSCHLG